MRWHPAASFATRPFQSSSRKVVWNCGFREETALAPMHSVRCHLGGPRMPARGRRTKARCTWSTSSCRAAGGITLGLTRMTSRMRTSASPTATTTGPQARNVLLREFPDELHNVPVSAAFVPSFWCRGLPSIDGLQVLKFVGEGPTDAANFAFDTTHAVPPCSVGPTSGRARRVSTCQVSIHQQERISTARSCRSFCRLLSASSGANPTQWSRARCVSLSSGCWAPSGHLRASPTKATQLTGFSRGCPDFSGRCVETQRACASPPCC